MVRDMNQESSDAAPKQAHISARLPEVPSDYLSMAFALSAPEHQGRIRSQLEDFQVVEDLGFEPSGDGHHLFIRVRKRGANTQWIAQRIAHAAGVQVSRVGYAGMKDRFAVTEQTFSLHLPGKPDPDLSSIEDEEFEVLEMKRNRRMVKRGGLRGNAFRIVVRDLKRSGETGGPDDETGGDVADDSNIAAEPVDRAGIEQRLERVAADGVPNYFGPQRFGHSGNNLAMAVGLFKGAHRERNRHKRGLYLSAARSYLFNQVLSQRVKDGTWNVALDGDTMSLDGSRSFFRTETIDDEIRRRLSEMDIHPSGPLWGQGKRVVAGEALALEERLLEPYTLWREGLEHWKMHAKRRSLRLPVREFTWSWEDDGALALSFALPAGTYATTVLREIIELEEPRAVSVIGEGAAASEDEDSED